MQYDVILVSGDAYIDSAYSGTAVIRRVLEQAGYTVGIVAQPDINGIADVSALGEPRLFWGVNAGCVDSMVANTTASLKRRRSDDFTEGGINNRRPDRACIQYTNIIRRAFKNTVPIILGGIEASLRRIAHYDYWTDSVRRSILFDSKADAIIYGMGERAVLEIAAHLKAGTDWRQTRGLCHAGTDLPTETIILPDWDAVRADKAAFAEMFKLFSVSQHKPLAQKHDTRYLIHNPAQPPLTTVELDSVHELPFTNEGNVRALDTIRFSVITHRGCFGACNFCSIAVHQGTKITSRSEASLIREITRLTRHPKWKGIVSDAGGPTANMYGFDRCKNHSELIHLLRTLSQISSVRKVFTASGIRLDLIAADKRFGEEYIDQVLAHHTSGQLKLAPEHTDPEVLRLMHKPPYELTDRFLKRYGRKAYFGCYFMAAHPGCTAETPCRPPKCEPSVQIFTPTPSTYSTLMYWTGKDAEGNPVYVEKSLRAKTQEKEDIIRRAGH